MSLALARTAEERTDPAVADAPDAAAPAGPVVDPRDRRGPMRPEVLTTARRRMSGAVVGKSFRWADAGVVVTAAALSLGVAGGSAFDASVADLAPVVVGSIALLAALAPLGAYRFARRERLSRHLGRVLLAILFGVAGCWATLSLLPTDPTYAAAAGVWAFGAAAALYTAHIGWWLLVRRWRKAGRLTPNVVVVGATPNAARLIENAMRSGEAAVLGVFDDRALTGRAPSAVGGVPVLGGSGELMNHRILPYVDRVVITVTASAQGRVRQLMETLRPLPNPVTLFVDIDGIDGGRAGVDEVLDAPLARLSGGAFDDGQVVSKRLQDLVLGVIVLIAAAPLMGLVALAVKLDSPGPVLFRQRRHGFNNEEITVWKFRSMRVEAQDATAARQVIKDDPRVTRIGNFIRKTSLDELPQVFNVLGGSMSLVGPRPHAIGMKTGEVESARLVAEYAWRHRIKPGVTGWAQINGSRGPVHTAADVRRRVQLDLEYVERQSLLFDLYVLAMTLPRLLGDRAAVR